MNRALLWVNFCDCVNKALAPLIKAFLCGCVKISMELVQFLNCVIVPGCLIYYHPPKREKVKKDTLSVSLQCFKIDEQNEKIHCASVTGSVTDV